MSISSAFNSAMSGLVAARRASEVVSENIANAMTPGYARRSLELKSAVDTGPGVRVVGVHRHSDPGIVANRRKADAEYGSAKVLADFHSRFEALVGSATDPDSLGMRLAEFDSSLIAAASRPDSTQRLDAIVSAANDLVETIVSAAEGVRQMRDQADQSIGLQVDRLNIVLSDVQKLNARITSTKLSGGEISALKDQRQQLVDEINLIVPVNLVNRDHEQIGLYTDGGLILLDGVAADLSFSPVNQTVPEMTVASGGLSELEINGIPVSMKKLSGGTLAANFQIRDDIAVTAQSDLDTVARDLIERFETATLDPTTAPGSVGVFTDNGVAFNPLLEIGISGRLSVNAEVDPSKGGQSWRFRAGLGATDPGFPGEARLLRAFSEVLNEARTPGSSAFGTGGLTTAGFASSLMSRGGQNNGFATRALAFASATKTELTQIEFAQGVDTDAELQNLMVIEKAYAANARMIEVVDEMMDALLRI